MASYFANECVTVATNQIQNLQSLRSQLWREMTECCVSGTVKVVTTVVTHSSVGAWVALFPGGEAGCLVETTSQWYALCSLHQSSQPPTQPGGISRLCQEPRGVNRVRDKGDLAVFKKPRPPESLPRVWRKWTLWFQTFSLTSHSLRSDPPRPPT